MRIKNSHYVGLQGWQVNELNLRGETLIVYAMIYQYRQFVLDYDQISEWTGLDDEGMRKTLKYLFDRNLIKSYRRTIRGTEQTEIVLSPVYEEDKK